ncbi:MAG: thioredoxin domain-containing protein [bacterium]
MKKNRTTVTSASLALRITTIILMVGIAALAISAHSATAPAAAKKPAAKTAAKKTPAKTAAKKAVVKAPEKKDAADAVGEFLRKGKSVFVYFYSSEIKDSIDQLDTVKKAAKKGGAEVVTIKTEDSPAPFYAYEGRYVPTVVLIRPDAGLVGFWEMDLSEEEMADAVTQKLKPNNVQKKIADAIKKKKPQLVFFMAKWCHYCMETLPAVRKFEKDFSDCVEIVLIDIDELPDMQYPYMVNGVPVIFLTDAGGMVKLRTGYPNGYDRFKEVFEGMGGATKSCMAGAKKTGDKT